ncbi:MAG: GNAT family N-acetyltransferase, partial [Gammaproteobacteria bacterium]
YTPVTGSRLLVRPDADRETVTAALVSQALELVQHTSSSSLHCLFTDERDTRTLLEYGLLRRTGCHFHWHNNHYASFEAFLADLTSRKRKKIRRERRYVQEAGIRMEVVHGHQASAAQWAVMHDFYRSTFEKKSGIPTLSLEFFLEISQTMGEQVVLVFALRDQHPVAGAIMLRSSSALYGRHWGCHEDYHSLHFETCYYQGIEYCIDNGISLFEPGAQGEHKISRGFLPTLTWSAHWILDEQFRAAITKYLEHEHEMIINYHQDLQRYSPFRNNDENARI